MASAYAGGMGKGQRRWWIGAALLCGLALRVYFVLRFARVAGDSFLYGDFARNWLQHGVYGFTRAGGPRATLIRLPGYPMFLAVCFVVFGVDHYAAVLWVQVLVDLGTCLVMAAIAGRLFGAPAGLAALWLGCLCPFTANYVAAPLTETLTLATIGVAFYGLIRWSAGAGGLDRWALLIATALGYTILLRPEQGLLAAAVVPAMLWIGWRRRGARGVRAAVVVSVLCVLPLVPWTIRNERTFGVLQPLAPKYATDPGERIDYGFQRWYRTFAIDFASTQTTYWNYESDSISAADLPNRAFDSQAQYEETDALMEAYNVADTGSPELDLRWDQLARQRIAANPLRYYVALPVARVVNMALRPRIDFLPLPLEWWKYKLHPRQTLFCYGYAGLNLAYLVLAGWAVVWRKRLLVGDFQPVVWAMVAMVGLRCALLMTIDNSEPRYTLEFFPVAVPLAAALVARWWVRGLYQRWVWQHVRSLRTSR